MVTIDRIQSTLYSWEGMSGRHPDFYIREKNAQLLCPNDPRAWALNYLYGFKKDGIWIIPSTCALVTQAYLRVVWGLKSPDLDQPYSQQIGQAVWDLSTIGKQFKCWVTDKDELSQMFDIGDAIQIGDGGIGGDYHLLNVVDISPDASAIESIDGGQVDGSYITRRERILIAPSTAPYNKGVWLVDPKSPYKVGKSIPTDTIPNGRIVSAKISAKRLAKNLGYDLI